MGADILQFVSLRVFEDNDMRSVELDCGCLDVDWQKPENHGIEMNRFNPKSEIELLLFEPFGTLIFDHIPNSKCLFAFLPLFI